MKRILVVDDDPVFAKTVEGVLDPSRFEVVLANNGKEGLERLEEKKPDAVLLDLLMPTMGGVQFLQELNTKYGKGSIPVLIVSNLSGMQGVSQGVELGVRGYIVKSDESSDTIATAVDRLFENKREQTHKNESTR